MSETRSDLLAARSLSRHLGQYMKMNEKFFGQVDSNKKKNAKLNQFALATHLFNATGL